MLASGNSAKECGQVAEWLMAADCKSAAPWSYGGSNPPLSTRSVRVSEALRKKFLMNKLSVAMGAYGLLAILAWQTLTEEKFRWGVLVILGYFAVKTLLHWREQVRERESGEGSAER